MKPTAYKHCVTGLERHSPLRILVVGAGGNGGQMLTALAKLHHTMLELGMPGLHVTSMDADTVSPSNIGRQPFYLSDVGLNKAEVLIGRINRAYGLSWCAAPVMLTPDTLFGAFWMVIGCVDTPSGRRAIHHHVTKRISAIPASGTQYWMDLGNRDRIGQYIVGQPRPENRDDWPLRLPTITDLWPDMLDPANDPADDGPSCSMAEAIERQDLFVNQILVSNAAHLIWTMIRYAEISFHGGFVNLREGAALPLRIDIDSWKGMGYKTRRPSGPKARELAIAA